MDVHNASAYKKSIGETGHVEDHTSRIMTRLTGRRMDGSIGRECECGLYVSLHVSRVYALKLLFLIFDGRLHFLHSLHVEVLGHDKMGFRCKKSHYFRNAPERPLEW